VGEGDAAGAMVRAFQSPGILQSLSLPLNALRFVVEFPLGQCSNDCRAGDHGHKCESYQNVVHGMLLKENPDPGPVSFDSSVRSIRRVTLHFAQIGNQRSITNLRFSGRTSIKKRIIYWSFSQ
jgi:hypothetical protein